MPTSVLIALSGSAHEPSSIGLAHSSAAAAAQRPSSVGVTLGATTTSVLTVGVSASNDETCSTGVWLLSANIADSIGDGVTGVWKAGRGAGFMLALAPFPGVPVC